jgi:hypothetical protein
MRWDDITLIAKKIGVGILIAVTPVAIIAGGSWASQKALHQAAQPIEKPPKHLYGSSVIPGRQKVIRSSAKLIAPPDPTPGMCLRRS